MPCIHFLSLVAIFLPIAAAYKPCPLYGPVFEPPTSLCEADIFQSALKNLSLTLNNVGSTGQTRFGAIPNDATSFSVGIFDAQSTLFSQQYTSPALRNGTEGTKEVNEDSIFRIGSGSKLITVYIFLVNAGAKYWNHPITEFVPELVSASRNCSARQDPVDCIAWEDITLGSLATHLAGLPRDFSTTAELLVSGLPVVDYGLPPLPESAYPTCGYNFTNACDKEDYIEGVVAEHPTFAPFTTPVYSNAGYQLLNFATERITGKKTADLATAFFKSLNMTDSSYDTPQNFTNAVLPEGPELSGFIAQLGGEVPVGGYYSSPADLLKMGQSILTAKLLAANTIRAWLKPDGMTSNKNFFVGKPWEIWRSTDLTDHVIDIYTKSGDLFSYSSMTAIIPDYQVGFIVLAAGNSTTFTVEALSDIVVATLLPALERTARAESQQKYAGTYTTAGLASNVSITTQPGQPGLVVSGLYSNGTDMLPVISSIEGAADGVDIRLYPSGLVQHTSPTSQRVGYRAVIGDLDTVDDGGVLAAACNSWFVVDSLHYGNVGIDEFVFDVEDGKVVSISPRALRVTLKK